MFNCKRAAEKYDQYDGDRQSIEYSRSPPGNRSGLHGRFGRHVLKGFLEDLIASLAPVEMTDQVLSFGRIDSSFCKARQVLDKNMVFGFRHH
jgi:hypothetical protein